MAFKDVFREQGEALLLAHEGERELARMLSTEVSRLVRRIAAWARRSFGRGPAVGAGFR